jgi:hypothetical protein
MIGWDAITKMRENPDIRFQFNSFIYSFRNGSLHRRLHNGTWEESTLTNADFAKDGWFEVDMPKTDEDLLAIMARWKEAADTLHTDYYIGMAEGFARVSELLKERIELMK